MRLKSIIFSSLTNRTSLPLPVLAVPGGGLILLGLMVYFFPAIFIFFISGGLILLGTALLFLAFRMRPRPTPMNPSIKKARIRVVESDETW